MGCPKPDAEESLLRHIIPKTNKAVWVAPNSLVSGGLDPASGSDVEDWASFLVPAPKTNPDEGIVIASPMPNEKLNARNFP